MKIRPPVAIPLALALAVALTVAFSLAPIPACTRPAPHASVQVLPIDDIAGLSGLDHDPAGSLWAVPERQPLLLELPSAGPPRRVPLRGLPEGLELESLAFLSPGHFALGTEHGCSSGSERILFARLESGEAHIHGGLDLPLSLWSAPCDPSHGIEGLCHASGHLIAVLEQTRTVAGQRRALGARVPLPPAPFDPAPFELTLTSGTGRISALACRPRADLIEVLAIERHFEVSRLITFSLPQTGPLPPDPLPATMALDISSLTGGGRRNFEGITWIDETHAALLVDNHYRVVTGPNELAHIEVPAR